MSVDKRLTAKGVRYEVRLRAPDGRERSRSFATRREAEKYDATQRADKARGGWIDPRHSATTLAEWSARWLDANPTKRESAWARDESALRVHVLPALGKRALRSITHAEVQGAVNTWAAKMRPRSVKRVYGTLAAAMAAAVNGDLIARTPCRGIKLPKIERIRRAMPDADGLARLAHEVGPDYAAMVYLGAIGGLRWGELAGLRVSAVDTLRRTVAVVEQATRGKGGRSVVGPPKSEAGVRTVAVGVAVAAMLAAHLARRGLTAADGDALVFVASEGGMLDNSHFRRRAWLPAVARAGIAGFTMHDLRRYSATALVVAGVDVKTAQTRLGHSDVRLTLETYAQAVTEADHDAAERVSLRALGSG